MGWMILPLKRYFDFSGRSRRIEYWMFTLFITLVIIGLGVSALAAFPFPFATMGNPEAMTTAAGQPRGAFIGIMLLVGIFGLGIIIPSIAVTVRRLHDRDLSGWWYLGAIVVGSIPYIGFVANIAFFVVMCLPGTPGPNRFGPDPLDPTSAEVFA